MVAAWRYFVRVDGGPLPDGLQVTEVRFDEQIVGRPAAASELELVVPNPGYRHTDAIALLPGREIDVYVSSDGTEAGAVHLAHAVVVKAEPRFVAAGNPPPIVVTARDASEAARTGDRVKGWPSQSDARKVEAIAKANGWATRWDGVSTIGTGGAASADNQSAADMRYLAQLAERYSYDVSVRWHEQTRRWVLWWGPPQEDDSDVRDLRHNDPGHPSEDRILAFAPIVAGVGQQVSGLRVAGFNVSTQTVSTGKYEVRQRFDRELRQRVTEEIEIKQDVITGATVRATVFGEAVKIRTDQPITSDAQARELAEQWVREHRDRYISGRGEMPGDPSIRAGQIHQLGFYASEDSGPRRIGLYSGRYLFSSVTHTLRTGGHYRVAFGARKKA